MEGFFVSFVPFLRRFAVELLLITAAILCTIVSIVIYNLQNKADSNFSSVEIVEERNTVHSTEMVEIEGAVMQPDVYEISEGARLKDVLRQAGGLSNEADKSFVKRNFNMARYVSDQEKIYIPSIQDIAFGYVVEQSKTLDYTQPITKTQTFIPIPSQSGKISLSIATIDELDTLPGIGQVTAQKILDNRPYGNIEDLLTKKVVTKAVFEKIKELITL